MLAGQPCGRSSPRQRGRLGGASPRPRATALPSVCGGRPSEGADNPEPLELRKDKHRRTVTGAVGLMVSRRAAMPLLLLPTDCAHLLGLRCRARRPPSLAWTWREVGCWESVADCGCSCTVSTRPGDFQGPRGMDASQLQSVTSDGWMHLDLLQRRTRSVPELSSYPPRSQHGFQRELMKKVTPPLHPFSRQQSFSPGEGTQLLNKLMGYGGSQPPPPRRHGPRGSRSQLGRGTLGLDPVGGPWWDAFAFPQEDRFLRTKAMALE